MKKVVIALVIAFAPIMNFAFAEGPLVSEEGRLDFRGIVSIVRHQGGVAEVQIMVRNRSNSDSHKSKQCPGGVASSVVVWRILNRGGSEKLAGPFTTSIKNFCNGNAIRIFEMMVGIPSKYSSLEVHYNIMNADKSHSFLRGRTTWN